MGKNMQICLIMHAIVSNFPWQKFGLHYGRGKNVDKSSSAHEQTESALISLEFPLY